MNDAIFNFLGWIRSWTGSWGLAMVVFTVLIRAVMTPLDYKSRIGMRKTTALQPKMAELQRKYANDKDKLNQKTAELYKKEGVNPMSSCLPMLLTWPILIIVFSAMRRAANIEVLEQLTQILNQQTPTMEPFLWIKNLWMPDNLFATAWPDNSMLRQIPTDIWTNWFNGLKETPVLLQNAGLTAESFSNANLQNTIAVIQEILNGDAAYVAATAKNTAWTFPLVGAPAVLFNGLMILPILSAVSQIVMTKVIGGQQNQTAGANDQAAATNKMMTWFFPIFSLVICFGYSSAFALYWVCGNLASMIQTVAINRVLDNQEQKAKIAGEGTVK